MPIKSPNRFGAIKADNIQLNQYVTQFAGVNQAIPTTPAVIPQSSKLVQAQPKLENKQENQQEKVEKKEEKKEQKPAKDENSKASITTSSPKIRGTQARVEYRDQQGNILDEAVVESLRKEGKVSFETKHETRTRLEHGHIVDVVDGKVAPPHPDVEGQNPETQEKPEEIAEDSPAPAASAGSSVEEPKAPEAKPASEGNEATP